MKYSGNMKNTTGRGGREGRATDRQTSATLHLSPTRTVEQPIMNKILYPKRLISDPEPWCRSWIGSDEGEALDFSFLESGGRDSICRYPKSKMGFNDSDW